MTETSLHSSAPLRSPEARRSLAPTSLCKLWDCSGLRWSSRLGAEPTSPPDPFPGTGLGALVCKLLGQACRASTPEAPCSRGHPGSPTWSLWPSDSLVPIPQMYQCSPTAMLQLEPLQSPAFAVQPEDGGLGAPGSHGPLSPPLNAGFSHAALCPPLPPPAEASPQQPQYRLGSE